MSDVTPLDTSLLPPRQMFRFAVDVQRWEPKKGQSVENLKLDESYQLPSLGELDGLPHFADMRMGWSIKGLVWQVTVAGKTQLPWCRESRLDESDGLQLWIDTRATLNVHRASRFCHRFVLLPRGAGRGEGDPIADQLLINRARENARPLRPRELQVGSKVTAKGYTLTAFATADSLGGYDPVGQPRLGFTYALSDRERGMQTLGLGPGFPYEEDPSCWVELRLVDA
ncbi:DOMON domain-containing protein [Adhaeretor mobilis]|uniref:Carbohydrate-binding domain-containing protein n=1 Tax=Adhaeretor mobilis TaxID=1930276 RepID=A0A517MQH9_9BACT|nr:hypothetical protein [Adhaeretor mobilis]QDS97136.1 hypothetical protein HG15A2_03960 [Adhaeretor mobilis]